MSGRIASGSIGQWANNRSTQRIRMTHGRGPSAGMRVIRAPRPCPMRADGHRQSSARTTIRSAAANVTVAVLAGLTDTP